MFITHSGKKYHYLRFFKNILEGQPQNKCKLSYEK